MPLSKKYTRSNQKKKDQEKSLEKNQKKKYLDKKKVKFKEKKVEIDLQLFLYTHNNWGNM